MEEQAVWVVTVQDRPPFVFATEKSAMDFIAMTLTRMGGVQAPIGIVKTIVLKEKKS